MSDQHSSDYSVKTVGLIGHCGFDSASLTGMVREIDSQIAVTQVAPGSIKDLGSDTLILVNRQLGGGWDFPDGVELIRKYAHGENAPRLMLISNYEDAQQHAIEAGGRPGFGKSELSDPAATERLKQAIK